MMGSEVQVLERVERGGPETTLDMGKGQNRAFPPE
jgi:hypothetical protein